MLSHFIRFVRTRKGAVTVLCALAVFALISANVLRETVYMKEEGQSKATLIEKPFAEGAAGAKTLPPNISPKNYVAHATAKAVPDMELQNASGDVVTLEDFAGDWLVVNFWATWCAPCRKEMPQLDALAERYAARGVTVLLLSVDRGGAKKPAAFLNELGVKHARRAYDPSYKSARAVRLIGLPTTLVINPQGKELGRLAGEADWDGPDVHALLDYYLEN